MVIITRPREHDDTFYKPSSLDYSQAYFHILRAARGGAHSSSSLTPAPVLLLVANDVDALCAARSLAAMLKEDDIAYRICPVDGYAALDKSIREDVVGNEELRTVIFLNFGSLLSIPTYFTTHSNPAPEGYILPPFCCIHLIDSHRPYNLDNLFATSELMDRIFVWDDGDVEERLGKEEKAYTTLEFVDEMSSSSDEESDEDEDNEHSPSVSSSDNEADDEHRLRKRRRREGDNDKSSPLPRSKRPPANILASHRNVLSRYYSRGTHYGTSVAAIMFLLSERLGRSDNDTLWMGILGFTTQYLNTQIPHGHYEDLAHVLASDVRAMNKAPSRDNESRTLGKPVDADDGRIRVVDKELRFTLYRHWSLESSMYHSPYVAGKLGIWRERGLSKLRGLMAKMGLSLAQCRQTYEHMDLDLRQTLVERIESIAPEYGLTECVYPSFVRTFGFRSLPLSAADAVSGLEALMCAAHGIHIEVDAPGLAFGGVGVGSGGMRGAYAAAMGEAGQGSDMFLSKRVWSCRTGAMSAPNKGTEEEDSTTTTARDCPAWSQNFFTAYSALDVARTESIGLMRASLGLSKALHDVIIKQGVFIIEKQLIRTLRSFRLVILKGGSELALFKNVQVLLRLGFWLVDALREIVEQQNSERKKRKTPSTHKEDPDHDSVPTSMPFVLAALDETQDRYTVVGINASLQYGDTVHNNFGLLFQEAAAASHARTKHDRFEASTVEVRKEDLGAFVEALHSML